MTMTSEETNNLFAFTDAVAVVLEILEQAREHRDKALDIKILQYRHMAYEERSRRVEAFEDLLEALSHEETVAHYVSLYTDREFED